MKYKKVFLLLVVLVDGDGLNRDRTASQEFDDANEYLVFKFKQYLRPE